MTMMTSFFYYYVTSVSVSLATATPHKHHLCEGAGFSLVCGGEGEQLRIHTAWYGRLAHDTESCVDDLHIAGNRSRDLQPDLDRDCGVSILPNKDAWCQSVDGGAGCRIAVLALDAGTMTAAAGL
jgi:hypothetical protein